MSPMGGDESLADEVVGGYQKGDPDPSVFCGSTYPHQWTDDGWCVDCGGVIWDRGPEGDAVLDWCCDQAVWCPSIRNPHLEGDLGWVACPEHGACGCEAPERHLGPLTALMDSFPDDEGDA